MRRQRRSKDGFVSATGMFKIAFPWAAHAEEKAERDYLKSLDETSQDEVAGNIWVGPSFGKATPQSVKIKLTCPSTGTRRDVRPD